MANNFYPALTRHKWFRLTVSIGLAFVSGLILLLIPIKAATPLQITAPPLAPDQAVSLSLPLGAEVVRAAGGLTITKSAAPSPVNHGELLTYTLLVRNETGSDLTDVTVTDTVPANTTCVGIDAPPGWVTNGAANCAMDGIAFWLLIPPTGFGVGGVISDGTAVTFRYVVQLDQPLPDLSQITNAALSYGVEALTPSPFSDIGAETVTALVHAPDWQITKSVNPTPTVQAGGSLTYTLIITNRGHLTTTGSYTITDQIPANTTYVAGSASPTATFSGSSLTWVLTEPVGIDRSITTSFVVTITSPITDGLPIVNQTYSITGGNTFSQAFGPPLTVTVEAPVTLISAKSDDPFDPIQPGDLLTYTLTITNDAASVGFAEDVIVTDTIPANTSFVAAGFIAPTTGATSTNGAVVTWTIISPNPIPPGQTASLTLTVQVDSPLPNGTILTNTHGLTSATEATLAVGPPITTTVASTPSLQISKVGLPQFVQAGDLLTYTIRYTNTGSADATGAAITDIFPISTSYVSSAGNPSPVVSGPIPGGWRWDIPPVPGDGGTGLITLTLAVDSPQPDGTVLTNVVTIQASEPASDTFTATNVITSAPILAVTKIGLPQPVAAGGLLTYTIRYTNTGNADATGVAITDIFPISTSYASSAGNPSPVVSGLIPSGWRWDIPPVPGDGGTGLITLTLAVDSPQPDGTVLTNVVTIQAGEPAGDTFTTTNTISSAPILTVTKTGLPQPVAAGRLLTYTIRYTNTGNADATGLVMTDIFPLNTGYVSSSGSPTPLSDGPIPGGRRWDLPTVPGEGGSGIITLTLAVDSPQPDGTVLTDVVTIEAVDQGVGERFTATNTISSTPIIQISKSGPASVGAGGLLTYTVTYTNAGNADATGVIITDTYEGAFETITATQPATVSTSPLPARITWNIGLLPADSLPRSQVVTITLPISLTEGTILTNSVSLTSAQGITAADTVTTTVSALRADLQAGKSRTGGGDIFASDRISYTITITNGGPAIVDALITDTFPAGAIQSVVSCDGCSVVSLNPGVLTWTVSSLLPNTPQSFNLILQSSPFYSDTFTNTVEITFTNAFSFVVDPDPDNNVDSVTDTIRLPQGDLQIDKTRQGSGDVIAGDRITYTITISNSPGSDTVDAVVTDTFTVAAIQSVVSCSGCIQGSGVLTWSVNGFAANSSQTFTVVLRTSASYSGLLINTAGITFTSAFSNAVDPDTGNNTDTTSDTVRPLQANFIIDKAYNGSNPVVIGQPVTYTLTITNTGPDTATAIVTDTVSNNLTFSSYTIAPPYQAEPCNPVTASQVVCTISGFTGTTVITLVFDTAGAAEGPVFNGAEISPESGVAGSGDLDFVTAPTLRRPMAELAISKTLVSSSTIFIGQPITYTLTLTNNGPDTVDVEVTDTFTNALLASFSGAACSGSGSGPLVCNLAAFTGTTVITVVLDTSASSPGLVNNTAQITATGVVDNDQSDNQSSAPPVTLEGVPQLTISKSATPASGQTVRPGQTIIYNLEVTNLSSATTGVNNVLLTDTLPLSVGYVTASSPTPGANGPFVNGNVITFTLSSLGIGSSLSASVEVTVTATTSGTIIDNTAAAASDETGAIGPAMTTHRVVTDTQNLFLPLVLKNLASFADLTISSFSINPANPSSSDNIVVTVVVENQGNASTGEGFWVDFYVNPTTLPSDPSLGRNRRWEMAGSSQGIAWSISTPLAAGQAITLTSNGAAGTVAPAPPPLTEWDGTLSSGSYTLYAFADSFDVDDPTGPTNVEIVESDEDNNLAGPINLLVPAGSGQSGPNQGSETPTPPPGPDEAAAPPPLAPRPDLGN